VEGLGKLSPEELKKYMDQGFRVRLIQSAGKTYVALSKDKFTRGAGPLDGYDPDMQALIRCLASKVEWQKCVEEAGLDVSDAGEEQEGGDEQPKERQGSGQQTLQQPQPQSGPNVRVEGGMIVVEREVELETIWGVKRIALDPRVYILYAYAQKYLGYPGSLGEFVSDCTILFFKERGIEVILKLPEGGVVGGGGG
jgi:hypothetical protein